METFFSTLLIDLLIVSVVFGVILVTLIQNFKSVSFIKKSWQVWLLNLFFSFAISIPFGMTFYDLNLKDSIWIGLFSFIEVSSIYELLKNHNFINYKRRSISNVVAIPTENEIVRDNK